MDYKNEIEKVAKAKSTDIVKYVAQNKDKIKKLSPKALKALGIAGGATAGIALADKLISKHDKEKLQDDKKVNLRRDIIVPGAKRTMKQVAAASVPIAAGVLIPAYLKHRPKKDGYVFNDMAEALKYTQGQRVMQPEQAKKFLKAGVKASAGAYTASKLYFRDKSLRDRAKITGDKVSIGERALNLATPTIRKKMPSTTATALIAKRMPMTPEAQMQMKRQIDDAMKKKNQEKKASQVHYELEIEKKAASYDARRKKQYQQLLKRMYGGNEGMMEALRQNGGDVGIYHGTPNLDAVLKNGLNRSVGSGTTSTAYGKGVYFGDRDIANLYGKNGGVVRLKKPSELKGTKTLYPKTTKAMTTDLKMNPKLVGPEVNKFRAYGGDALKRMDGLVLNGQPINDIHISNVGWELGQQLKKKDKSFVRRNLDKGEYSKNVGELRKLKQNGATNKQYKKAKRMTIMDSMKQTNDAAPTNPQFLYKTKTIDPNLLTEVKDNANPKNVTSKVVDSAKNNKTLSRNAKIGLGLGAGALALGAGAYGLKKLRDKKKEENNATL